MAPTSHRVKTQVLPAHKALPDLPRPLPLPPSLTLPQPHRAPRSSNTVLPQDLCTGCPRTLCLHYTHWEFPT